MKDKYKTIVLFEEGNESADMYNARMRYLHIFPPQAYMLDFGCDSDRDAKAKHFGNISPIYNKNDTWYNNYDGIMTN